MVGGDVAADGDPHSKQGPWMGSTLTGLYQLVAKCPHPKVSHHGDGSSDSSWIQCSWVSPSQGWLGRGLGACMDLVSPHNPLGGSDGAKLGSSPSSLEKALAKPWLKTPPISACSGWSTLDCQVLGHLPPEEGHPWGQGRLTQGPANPLMVSASASLMKSWYKAT